MIIFIVSLFWYYYSDCVNRHVTLVIMEIQSFYRCCFHHQRLVPFVLAFGEISSNSYLYSTLLKILALWFVFFCMERNNNFSVWAIEMSKTMFKLQRETFSNLQLTSQPFVEIECHIACSASRFGTEI